MRWALIIDGVCSNVVEQESAPTIGGTWINADTLHIGPGHKLVAGNWVAPSDAVPASVTMRQARLALLAAGKLAAVESAIAALPEPAKTAATIEWEYSNEVQRHNGFVAQLGPALSMTEAQLDALFVQAKAL